MKNSNHHRKVPASTLFWALLLIALALLLLLDAIGLTDAWLPRGLSIWQLLLGGILLWLTVLGFLKANAFLIYFPLAGLTMIFDELILFHLGSPHDELVKPVLLLLIALLLSIGTQILISSFSTLRSDRITDKVTARRHAKGAGTSTRYFDCTTPFHSNIENNLGCTLVFFSNTQGYLGESSLSIENNLGSVVLHVPEDWQVIPNVENSLGSVHFKPAPHLNVEKRLVLRGENNLGSIVVKYVPADLPADTDAAQGD